MSIKVKEGLDFIPLYKADTVSKFLKNSIEVTGYYKCTSKGKHIITDLNDKEHEIDVHTLKISFDTDRDHLWSKDFNLMFQLQFNALTTSYYEEYYSIAQSGDGYHNHTAYPIDQQERVFDVCAFLEKKDISTKVFHHTQLKDFTKTLKEYGEGVDAIGFMKV